MNTETYQTFRTELITLLSRGTSLLPATEEQGQKLRHLQAKLLEDQFTIALVAGFQCGKSTTFNALCDGRALSPLGFGAKTSGCLVFAQNLADPAEPERGTVNWRAKDELLEGFDCGELPDFREKIRGLDLDKPEDCSRLKQAAEEEYDRWRKDKASYDCDAIGLLDVIRCALLVARFYGDRTLGEMRRHTGWKPEDLSRFIRFPLKWDERWMKQGLDAFTLEEAIFVFVGEIHFGLHSNNLARIGSVILDCPGLFASKWDSAVALRAIEQADAILYLTPGDRAISQSDLLTLKKIHAAEKSFKLFYALNMQKSQRETVETILPACKAIMQGAEINATDAKFFFFHADLALRALQGEALLNAKLDDFTQESTLQAFGRRDAQGDLRDSIEALLLRRMQTWRSRLDIDDQKLELTPAGVAAARRDSGLSELLEAIEGFVIQRKAKIILIENGANIVVRALKRVEDDLSNREAAAEKNKEEQLAQLAHAESRLRQFETECSGFLEEINGKNETPDYKLAEDFCETLDGNWLQGISADASRKISNEIVKPYFQTLRRNKADIQSQVRNSLADAFDSALQDRFSGWFEQIKLGHNAEYNRWLRDRVVAVQKQINTVWANVRYGQDVKILERVDLVQLTGEFQKDLQIAVSEFKKDDVALDISGLAGDVGGDGFFAGLRLAVLGSLKEIGSFLRLCDDDREATVHKRILKAISSDQARLALEKHLKPRIQNNIKHVRRWYTSVLEEVFQSPGRAFRQQRAERERLLMEADATLARIASDARNRRTGEIEPLRRDVESFEARCRFALPGQS